MALIDRAELFNRLSDKWDKAELYAVLQGMPEVEAEPVRHGKWSCDEDAGVYVCSVCNGYTYELMGDVIESDNGGFLFVDSLPNYCHRCGARMDGAAE